MPTINQTINKGLTTTTIQSAQNATQLTINKAKNKLLEPLVKDNELRRILIQDNNFDKLKNRLTYQITCQDWQKNNILKTELYGRTIKEAIDKLNQDLYGKRPEYTNLKGKGYWNTTTNLPDEQQPRIVNINLKIIFRKG